MLVCQVSAAFIRRRCQRIDRPMTAVHAAGKAFVQSGNGLCLPPFYFKHNAFWLASTACVGPIPCLACSQTPAPHLEHAAQVLSLKSVGFLARTASAQSAACCWLAHLEQLAVFLPAGVKVDMEPMPPKGWKVSDDGRGKGAWDGLWWGEKGAGGEVRPVTGRCRIKGSAGFEVHKRTGKHAFWGWTVGARMLTQQRHINLRKVPVMHQQM